MDPDHHLRRATAVADDADRSALVALRRALPTGRMVKWNHGEHERLGEVIEVLGFRFAHARVRVRSITGKVVDVGAGTILASL